MSDSSAAATAGENDNEAVSERLRGALAAHVALPYLFVGSGLSRRYLGLPDWTGLLRHFAEEIGEDFDFHVASANGNLPAAASSIARAFHPRWWADEQYEDQRAAYRTEVKNDEGGLKVAIAAYVRELQELAPGRPGVDDEVLAAEVEELRHAEVDGVITTNYDSLTDQIFPSFPPYVGQDELLLSDAQFVAETYKIHGSAERPMSLVLTAGDYERFSRRNHYLAAKLLTIFAEHPVVFVGYSLNDEYLGEILDDIVVAVGPDRINELGQRIYFVEWNPDPAFVPVIEQASLVRGGNRLPITRVETHELGWIWDALSRLERPFPAAVLRALRKHVFDLVTHPEPGQTREVVRAIPIESEEGSGLRVVFGVGTFTQKDLEDLSSISGRTLSRNDIERDVLGVRERGLDAENVLRFGIPQGVRPSPTSYLPVHKYLAEARLKEDGSYNFDGLPELIRTLAERTISFELSLKARFERDVAASHKTPRALLESDLPVYFKLTCLLFLDPADYELEELREVLAQAHGNPQFRGNESYIRKAICHYDRLSAGRVAAEGASPTV